MYLASNNPEGKAALDSWEARKLISSLTLSDLALGFFFFFSLSVLGLLALHQIEGGGARDLN